MDLRCYQHDLACDVLASFENVARSIVAVLPTGGGKTPVLSYIVTHEPGNIWVVAHRQELITQASSMLGRFSVPHGIVKSGYPFDPTQRVQVASIQTLARRHHLLPAPALIVWDECFPAGTLVDGIPIENLQVGDEVWSVNHDSETAEKKAVLGKMCRQHGGSWVKIRSESGHSFVCTDNHPIFVVGIGYIPAIQLVTLQIHELQILCQPCPTLPEQLELCPRILQSGVPTSLSKVSNTRASVQRVWDLIYTEGRKRFWLETKNKGILLLKKVLHCLPIENCINHNVGNEPPTLRRDIRTNAEEQSDGPRRNSGKDAAVDERKKVQTTRREWPRNTATSQIGRGNLPPVGSGCSHCFGAAVRGFQQLTNVLQSRFGRLSSEVSNRGRRERTSASLNEDERPEERCGLKVVGVDSVEVYQRESGSRPSWVPEGDTVYNIHVEGNNNYFAEGVLVHNCHHCLAETYQKIHRAYPQARNLGVTATPCRLNGQGLGGIFEHMILGPTTRWLTDNGFLSPAEYYAPPQVADTSNLHIRAGDFAKEEITAAMDKPTVTGDAVEHYRRICDGVPMLVFCTSVAHAKHVAAQYTEAGYRAASVDGAMSDEDRADRILGLGTGKWQVITSCDLIGEGLDVPVVGAVQLLRPTASLGLHLQQLGRGLRPVEGKSRCVVLDHVGNVRRHGFATTEHQWTLAGRVKRAKAKEVNLRTCEMCFLAHEPAPVCPMCGFEYPVKERALHRIETVDGKLVKLEETKEERADALRSARSMAELIAFAKARGYSKPAFWARKVYHGRSYSKHMPKL